MWFGRAVVALAALGRAAAAFTGMAMCEENMCMSVQRENGTDTYTMTPTRDIPQDKFGWVAVAWGDQMPGSSSVIMWPNADGSITLSQRHTTGHVQPKLVSNPERVATLDETRSFSNSSKSAFSFSIPSSPGNQTQILWAMSRTNPKSSDPGANLIQHTWHGFAMLALDAEWTGRSLGPYELFPEVIIVDSGTSVAMNSDGSPSFALIAHITCGVLVTMLVLPGGVVVPRITRGITTTRRWFYFHMINQGIIAFALVIAAFTLGLKFGGDLDSRHRKTGVALFALVVCQVLIGLFSHLYNPGPRAKRYTFETRRGRGPSNFLHVAWGLIVVAVGWSAAWTGMTDEWPRRGHGTPAKGFRIGWGMFLLVWISLYILGIIFFLPRQLQIESAQRAADLREQKKFFPTEFDLDARSKPKTPAPPPPVRDSPPGTPTRSSTTWPRSPDRSSMGTAAHGLGSGPAHYPFLHGDGLPSPDLGNAAALPKLSLSPSHSSFGGSTTMSSTALFHSSPKLASDSSNSHSQSHSHSHSNSHSQHNSRSHSNSPHQFPPSPQHGHDSYPFTAHASTAPRSTPSPISRGGHSKQSSLLSGSGLGAIREHARAFAALTGRSAERKGSRAGNDDA